jgi:UrcA family protein
MTTVTFPSARAVMFGLAASTATALMLFGTQRACADSDVSAPSAAVHYNAQELATSAGTRVVYTRLTGAARAVCPEADSRDLANFAASRRCQREALSRAVRAIDDTTLTQMAANGPQGAER